MGGGQQYLDGVVAFVDTTMNNGEGSTSEAFRKQLREMGAK